MGGRRSGMLGCQAFGGAGRFQIFFDAEERTSARSAGLGRERLGVLSRAGARWLAWPHVKMSYCSLPSGWGALPWAGARTFGLGYAPGARSFGLCEVHVKSLFRCPAAAPSTLR